MTAFEFILIVALAILYWVWQFEKDKAKARSDAVLILEKRLASVDKVIKKFVVDAIGAVVDSVTSRNLETSRKKIDKIFHYIEKNGFEVSGQLESHKILEKAYKEAVKRDLAREEQARIKERIREEARAEREFENAIKQAERDQRIVAEALERALREAKDEHSAEVLLLKERLAEAETKLERAKSMAQLTKAGHIYVISNIGSFGENVYKIGMTRRLEPMDRVKELGDASVPFPFDVHMMIACDDAPTLEHALHKQFHERRMNKANLRKEFFRVSLDEVAQAVENLHGKVEYIATPEALDYHETLAIEERGFTAPYDERTCEETDEAA